MSRIESLKYVGCSKKYINILSLDLDYLLLLYAGKSEHFLEMGYWDTRLNSSQISYMSDMTVTTAMIQSHYTRHHWKAEGQLLLVMITFNEQGLQTIPG